ncbi:hypothetical protein BGZ98_009475 [Dissophora globulifera]|nr:hypothetical protein BGZ98_009475 [Dissophora globulifera]
MDQTDNTSPSPYQNDPSIPHDAEVVHFSYSLNPQQYSRLTVKLDYGISGDVVISQSENFFEKNILIYGSMKASTLPLFDCMSHTLIRDSYASTAKHFIFADMPYPELEEALKKYAMRVTLSVVIPRHLDNYAAIEILSSFQGDVRVALNDGRLTEGLTVKANQGNVILEGLNVLGPLKVEARHGKVQAKVGAERIVKMSASGPLELEITSTGEGLDLDVVSFYEQASLILVNTFV